MADYTQTLERVETYFDRTATKVWERLTSDAPVSRIRQTVREGRDAMRATILSRLPIDLTGARILDAGCGTGAMTAELARRGATVVAVDIAPQLVDIAAARLPEALRNRVQFRAGDMLDDALGTFDFTVAMDSLIYYTTADIAAAIDGLSARTARAVLFTVAPKTPLLSAMWSIGRLFPRADRSPTMIPQDHRDVAVALGRPVIRIARIARGFYISDCLEVRP